MTVIAEPENLDVVADGLKSVCAGNCSLHSEVLQPWELVEEAERKLTPRVRLVMKDVLSASCQDSAITTLFSGVSWTLFSLLTRKKASARYQPIGRRADWVTHLPDVKSSLALTR